MMLYFPFPVFFFTVTFPVFLLIVIFLLPEILLYESFPLLFTEAFKEKLCAFFFKTLAFMVFDVVFTVMDADFLLSGAGVFVAAGASVVTGTCEAAGASVVAGTCEAAGVPVAAGDWVAEGVSEAAGTAEGFGVAGAAVPMEKFRVVSEYPKALMTICQYPVPSVPSGRLERRVSANPKEITPSLSRLSLAGFVPYDAFAAALLFSAGLVSP